MPYWEFQVLIEDWIDYIKEEDKKNKDEEKKQKTNYKEPKTPNYKMPNLNFPKMK